MSPGYRLKDREGRRERSALLKFKSNSLHVFWVFAVVCLLLTKQLATVCQGNFPFCSPGCSFLLICTSTIQPDCRIMLSLGRLNLNRAVTHLRLHSWSTLEWGTNSKALELITKEWGFWYSHCFVVSGGSIFYAVGWRCKTAGCCLVSELLSYFLR